MTKNKNKMADIKKIHVRKKNTTYDIKDEVARQQVATKVDAQQVQQAIEANLVPNADVTVDDNIGTPSAYVTKDGNTLHFGFRNLKGQPFTYEDLTPEQIESLRGQKGDPGDSVIVGQGDLPLSNVVSDASDKAITPKAVLDNIASTTQLEETDRLYAYCIQIDGEIVSTSSTKRYISTFAVEGGKTYLISGFNPSNTGAADQKVIAAAYGQNGGFVGYFCLGDAENTVKGMVTMPAAAASLKIFGGFDKQAPEAYSVSFVKDRLDEVEAKVDDISMGITVEIDAESTQKYKNIAIDGSIGDAQSDRYVALFKVTGGRKYLISGFNPSSAGNYCIAAWYDATDPESTPQASFISYLRFGSSESSVDEEATAPANAAYIRIFGGAHGEQLAVLKEEGSASEKMDDMDKRIKEIEEGSTSIPPLFNLPPMPKASSETLRVLCFGSSWFMDTWWYLNHIIASAGINAELHCYYVGGSNFSEWLDFYDDDITSVSSRAPRATKNISINGADWTISQKGVGGYTYQDIRDDWFADLTEGTWDIIAFQQGAASSTDWELWEDGFEVAKMLKKHASPRTHIAFNSTWAPAVSNVSILPTTGKAAQLAFQKSNWANTMRFMAKSGIANVSPGGKVMYLLRESNLNTANDLADDTLHPNNGISIYALGGAFFDTFIAPMYNVPFASVDWLPTSDTEKAIVAGTSFDAISTSARDTIREIVREAVSDRFVF